MQDKLLSCEFYHITCTVLLSFFSGGKYLFYFLLCKFLPPVLVSLREVLFVRRTVLMLLPSQKLNLAL